MGSEPFVEGHEPEPADARKPTSDAPLRVNPGVLTVTTAVRIFIDRLDKERRLIDIAEKDRRDAMSSVLRPYARRLETRDRVGIEARVQKIAHSRRDKIFDKLAANAPDLKEAESQTGTRVYPIATEQAIAVSSRYFDEVEAEAWAEIQELYRGQEDRLNYAIAYYMSLSRPNLTETLAASLVPSSVYAFEEFLGALARSVLTILGPESLGDLPPIPYRIIESYGQNVATMDLKRWAIDRRVDEFVRGGYAEWCDSFENWCNVDIQTCGDWNVIREAIARTRLLSRSTGSRVDMEYVTEVGPPDQDDILWTKLRTTADYFDSLSNELEVACLCLGLRWAQHFFPDPEADVDMFIERIVQLESRQLWTHALLVADTLLDTFVHRDHPSFGMACINQWLCRQELGTEDEPMRRAIEVFQPANSWERIGLSAIRRDWPALTSAIDEHLKENKWKDDPFLRHLPIMVRSFQEYPALVTIFEFDKTRKKSRRSKRRRPVVSRPHASGPQ